VIDWIALLFGAMWVSASAAALAALGIANHEARLSGGRLRDQLQARPCQVALSLAGALFCAGLLGASAAVWERIAWGVLAAGFCALAWRSARESTSTKS
jgi:hypothetical protein